MLVRFYVSYGTGVDQNNIKSRIERITDGMQDGLKLFGDELEIVHNALFDKPGDGVDVACCWGVHENTKEIIKSYTSAGKRILYFDKAYIRRLGNERQGHLRIGMDGSDSLKYMMRKMRNFDRWESLRIGIKRKKEFSQISGRGSIVYAASSQKYSDFHSLGDANDYAEKIFKDVRVYARKYKMVYRPKPSWKGYREIEGVRISTNEESLLDLLGHTFLMITHGSAAAVEAIVEGVPVVALGPCPAKPVSNTEISSVVNPYFPSDDARFHWLCNLAYCQWTVEEFRSGEAWGFLRNELNETQNTPNGAVACWPSRGDN